MMLRYILIPWIVLLFLVIGCATTQPQVQVTKQPVYVEKPKRVDVNTVISQLSHQISSTMLEQNKRRVAVMNFSLVTGEMTELGLYLSDKLTNSLFQYRDKFEVIERTRLESILKEIKLGFTGIIDDKTAQSIGKILGADAIVIGTITDLGEEVDINIRMLGTERANVLAVASALLAKSDAIVKLIANVRVTEPGTAKAAESKTDVTTPPQPKAMPKVEVNDFSFEARECERYGERILCNIVAVNRLQETRLLGVWPEMIGVGYSLLIDNFGNQYRAEELIFGSERKTFQICQNIPPNLPMNITLIFRGVSPNASTGSTVILCNVVDTTLMSDKEAEIARHEAMHGRKLRGKIFKAVLRNIPLTR